MSLAKALRLYCFLGYAQASATLYTSNPETQKHLFENFKAEYNKNYAVGEEGQRFEVFISNLKNIDARNDQEEGRVVHGITKFADYTEDEFKTKYLNSSPELNNAKKAMAPPGVGSLRKKHEPSSVDWTGVYTTPVKDQGDCNAGWAFAATEQMESDYWRTNDQKVILSVQQVVSCAYEESRKDGCDGGTVETAMHYGHAGLELEEDYPYTSSSGVSGSCEYNESKALVETVPYYTGCRLISDSAANESDMATFVLSYGPVSVGVDASTWSSYKGGILSTCGKNINHYAQVVGVDLDAGYWKVRNSWGTSWGEDGFIRLAYGNNTCEIASNACDVKTDKVPRPGDPCDEGSSYSCTYDDNMLCYWEYGGCCGCASVGGCGTADLDGNAGYGCDCC